jgi:hypothetical protein
MIFDLQLAPLQAPEKSREVMIKEKETGRQ